jgi:hypothetical protein
VIVRGDWFLWIYECDWKILFKGKVIAENVDKKYKILKALEILDGQKLENIIVNKHNGDSIFKFDLGCKIETNGNEEIGNQWLLYEPNKLVLSIRSDGHYSYQPENTERANEIYLPMK